jgi:cation diffusion facilitator CzcD-associated flavoprotein CzcO
VLSLKRLQRLESVDVEAGTKEPVIEVEWSQESFDAVVVSQGLEDGGPHIPDIPGLVEWSKAPAVDDSGRWSVYHSRTYRHPERYANKVCRSPKGCYVF